MSAALLVALAPGCLMPQSVDPAQTRPHIIPRVDLKGLPPYLLKPEMTLYPHGPMDPISCHCVLDIDLNVIADDPTVNVEGRLFVDYDLAVPTSQRRIDTRVLDGSFQSSPSDTMRPVRLTIDADQFGLTPGPTPHVFEFVLAEQAGFDADSVSPPQRATKPPWDSSVLKFNVVVQASQNPARPTCDFQAVPPQVRVCSP